MMTVDRLARMLTALVWFVFTAHLASVEADAGPMMPRRNPGQGSIAACSITVGTSVREETALVAAQVANATAAFVCDQTDLGNRTVEEAAMQAAEDVSVTAATLIARLNVNCFASGMSTVRVNGMGVIEREAFNLANAVVENITDIRVCMDCNETAASVAGNFSDLLMAASANASIALELVTNEAGQEVAVQEFVQSVTQVFVVDFTRVLINSRTSAVDEGCPAPLPTMRRQVECNETMPVQNNGMCFGTGIDVPMSCATPGFFCVTRGPRFAACRLNGIPRTEEWEGIVFECI